MTTYFPKKIIKPRRLKKGSIVGLVAPASFLTEEQVAQSVQNVEMLGFRVKQAGNLHFRQGYFAGSDAVRADSINAMFADTSVDAILCARGGYGCARILDLLDYKMIRRNPKPLLGLSDITVLLHGILHKTGLVGFHSPLGVSPFTEYTTLNFKQILTNPSDNIVINCATDDTPYVIKSGVAEGELLGGTITLLNSLLGTKYDLSWKGKIVFIEDIGEEPYKIDRLLTQLHLAGKFNGVSGILLGNFKRCEASQPETSFTLREVLTERLERLNVPVLAGFSFGHVNNNCTLPVGIKARLDTEYQTVTLLENAVI